MGVWEAWVNVWMGEETLDHGHLALLAGQKEGSGCISRVSTVDIDCWIRAEGLDLD